MKRWNVLGGSPALMFALGVATNAFGQTATETVWLTGPGQVSRVDAFGPCGSGHGIAEAVFDDGGPHLGGMVVRGDRCMVAADATADGGGLRMYDAAHPAILGPFTLLPGAVGVDADSSENLFAVSDDAAGPDRLLLVRRNDSPGCTPDGYDSPIVLDSEVDGAAGAADVHFVRVAPAGAAYRAGDVLVLLRHPARILRYSTDAIADALTGGGDAVPQYLSSFVLGSVEPTSFALAQGGSTLFVATAGGKVLRFRANGTAQGTFASFPGKRVTVSVGLQGGVERAFVAISQAGRVRAYDVATATCHGEVSGLSAPVGVENASLHEKGAVATPSSPHAISVAPAGTQQITFESVNASGRTTSEPFYVVDPAPGTDRAITVGGVTRTVPAYVNAFPRTGSPCPGDGACPTFLVYMVGTSADAFGATIEHHFEENALGWNTTCYAADGPSAGPFFAPPAAEQPRTFYATDANDPPIVEGLSYTDISTFCGSNGARGGETSLLLLGWDSRSTSDISSAKLGSLDAALNGTHPCAGGLAPFIAARTLHKLRTLLDAATSAFESGHTATADAKLAAFIEQARLGSFKRCLPHSSCAAFCRNAPGELIARAESARFLICGAAKSCERKLLP